ncbi:hypothetical protein HPB49_005483 [Dermacentor silvarum]|uniref:Uncharacterized protein n=1 Tax=Dermacentor silvarum TaxID=543639 RepID=A0ACB8DVP3_DERSI|nr:hypothetical protein HPB49_005483 [Dermacentor silvarum]
MRSAPLAGQTRRLRALTKRTGKQNYTARRSFHLPARRISNESGSPRHSVTCLCIAACRFATSEEFWTTTARRQVSFFCFPKDPHLKKKWIVAIKRDEGKLFVVTKHTKVCSNHFTADSYLPNVVGDRRYLRVDAVPSVFAFGKPKPPARKKPKDRQQCVAKRKLLSAIGQASSSGFASQPLLSPSSDVAASRDSSTAIETMDATECESSVSTPASATHVRDHEVCDCACAVRVSELEKQLSVLQMRIHQLESDLEGSTEEVKSAKANAVRVPELEKQLSLRQVCIQLESDLEIRTKEVKSAKDTLYKAQRELRLGLFERDLAYRFMVSIATTASVPEVDSQYVQPSLLQTASQLSEPLLRSAVFFWLHKDAIGAGKKDRLAVRLSSQLRRR